MGQKLIVVFLVGEFGVKHDPVAVEDNELEHGQWRLSKKQSVLE
jgi:hypothetical protein